MATAMMEAMVWFTISAMVGCLLAAIVEVARVCEWPKRSMLCRQKPSPALESHRAEASFEAPCGAAVQP